jgi:hypothetical protein
VGLANLGSESETCVGSRVRLVGVSISFEQNFYRLPFTPPFSGLPYRSFSVFVPGPREVIEALWNICCAAVVATSLTGSVHRSDRCHRSDAGHRSVRCSTGSKPCKFPLCVLVSFGSGGCLLVARISSTPVATWSRPTWVVESKTRVGSRVHLVGASISFEKNFYRLPFTSPPLFGSPFRSFRFLLLSQPGLRLRRRLARNESF